MKISRRKALKIISAIAPAIGAGRLLSQRGVIEYAQFENTRSSLRNYQIPEWFADAKFGIWSHWGPQSAIGDGDWYARNMYVEGEAQYEYHRQRFGPQCKVGYKDLLKLFTADRWDPDYLIDLYVKAGAKYFVSMGVHHDNFDLWNSKYQPRWNSVAIGPKRDIVGEWANAARKRGLRFGVSEHLSNSFDWFAPAHLSDTKGQYASIPYDGCDPKYKDLYHDYSVQTREFIMTAKPMGRVAPDAWKQQYKLRIHDLLEQHRPDLLYTDGYIEWEEIGMAEIAEIYNSAAHNYRGETEGVFFSKKAADCEVGTCVLDRERDVSDSIVPRPWQTDTCIGEWHYKIGAQYKSAKKVIDLLVDIVAKNGNLLLNFPLPASGELDAEEKHTLEGITEWMSVNSEGIYATRPYKVYGEGPATKIVVPVGDYNESKKPDLGAEDVRFTRKGTVIYAFVQGWPVDEFLIRTFADGSEYAPGRILDVRTLGYDAPLKFVQDSRGLHVAPPSRRPQAWEIGIALKICTA